MNKYVEVGSKLKDFIGAKNVFFNEPMKYHTSFKIGGPVDVLVTPENSDQVELVIKYCKSNSIPYYIIGNGSNLLVKDKGIRGVIIKLIKLNKIRFEDNVMISEAGASIGEACEKALEAGLTGMEFSCGIPGSVGGAVAMNAGAYISEIGNVIKEVLVIDDEGNIKHFSKEELELGYRTSIILKKGYTVIEATFDLQKGDHGVIKKKIDELQKKRKDKQPLEYPSAGSTFKRPEGYYAGKLIEDSGLKGKGIGDAVVSEKHSGFVINKGEATAKDILNVIEMVQKTVYEKYKVELHTEVRIIGED